MKLWFGASVHRPASSYPCASRALLREVVDAAADLTHVPRQAKLILAALRACRIDTLVLRRSAHPMT